MGRIKFYTVGVYLFQDGYEVRVTVFGDAGVIRQESYDKMSWRECTCVLEVVPDLYRPGTELMHGGVQESLF